MKPFRCQSCNLFFDADKYKSCPHCSADMLDTSLPVIAPADNDKKKNVAPQAAPAKNNVFAEFNSGLKFASSSRVDNVPADKKPETKKTDVAKAEAVKSAVPSPASVEKTPSIISDVRKSVASNDFSDENTVAHYNYNDDLQPVVGWLVCVKGKHKGESFALVSGNNTIGRSPNNNVILAKDRTVSRERHAAIVFEPQKKLYFIQGGKSNAATTLNDEPLTVTKQLKYMDKITLGMCELIFISLCNGKFDWNNYN